MTRALLPQALLLCSLALLGCDQDAFTIVDRPDGSGGSTDGSANNPNRDGSGGLDGGTDAGDGGPGTDIGTDACVPQVELCDGKDNNCNGTIDDVSADKVQSDPANCGACGDACSYINAFARCEEGKCVMDDCAPGYYDINKQDNDGCEYQCLKTNGGVEECPPSEPDCGCDGADNDCDGQVDEVFDKTSDANNCSACGNRCLFNNATGSCVNSQCAMGACELGFKNLNSNIGDGCEYKCPIWPATTEVCNGEDDDCDGNVDEGLPGAGEVCDTGLLGECQNGITQCQAAALECVPQKSSTPELCDQLDNDCDGAVDEDFNLQIDLLNCGSCGNACSYANGIPKCDAGVCKLEVCAGGYADLNNDLGDGCEHKCAVFPTTNEVCNGKDDDCDTLVDEGFDLQSDLAHCGACNNACGYPNASAQCVNGVCQMGNCDANTHDVNNSASDGCEYFCVRTNGGVEACDNVDNDCDGVIDNGFNLAADKNNCGSCGNACVFNNAQAACVARVCVLAQCDTGFKNLDGQASNGCEYQCPVYPPATSDPCDGVDNDCDGALDEDFTSSKCGDADGECVQGNTACVGGVSVCQNATGPQPELCDGKDNDCDTVIDNGFDKLNDPRYCANCAGCSLNHAIASCSGGNCGIAVCENGWVNLDNSAANGCEYNCTVTGVEICDGIDNDCDGDTDEGVALGGNPCIAVAGTPCAGTTATCQGSLGWVCNYPSTVQLRSCTTDADCDNLVSCTAGVCPGIVASDESLCDNLDNDCDTAIDETFANKNTSCAETGPGKVGICQGKGVYQCTSDKLATQCVITTPGQSATNEACNGLDDDCDGLIDEEADDAAGLGVVDAMVQVGSVWVYAYEASRPDASSGAAGVMGSRACSKPGVRPWANVTHDQAKQACQDAGKRLCTESEWQRACEGPPTARTYPYGSTYGATTCNGKDNDADPGTAGNQDAVLATGAKSACKSYENAFDLSGNLMEWTGTEVGDLTQPPVTFRIRGGSFNNIAEGLTCQLAFVAADQSFLFNDLGFRCCSDAPP